MQELLSHPAVQAGLAPFLAALITAELFRRIQLSGLAIIAGFALTIYLVSNFTLEPLTATRKIVLLGLISAALGLLLSLIRLPWFSFLLPILGATAAVWTVLGVIMHQTPQVMLLWGAGCAAYVATLVWGMSGLEHASPRAASAAAALGIGTGGAALFGASALLGQFGLALGAAAGAHLLIQIFTNKTLPAGHVFTLPVAMIAGLTGCVAVLNAQLPWYVLPVLAFIPFVPRLVPLHGKSVRIQGQAYTLLMSVCAGGAIFLTWQVAGGIPL